MIIFRILPSVCLLASIIQVSSLAAEREDVLRFSNSDQLHGTYHGINEDGQILWLRKDIATSIPFASKDLMSIVLAKTQPNEEMRHSFVRLSNHDIVPAEILEIDDTTITIRSQITGEVCLARKNVSEICPQPFGKKILYTGPYSKDGWIILDPNATKEPPVEASEEKQQTSEKKNDATATKKSLQGWQQHGISWYRKDSACFLTRKNCLAESTMLRFRAKWLGRLNINVTLHADFMPTPDKKGEKGGGANENGVGGAGMFMNQAQSASIHLLGNALSLNIYQNYVTLSRSGYSKEGKLQYRRISQSSVPTQIQESGDVTFEIRSDRKAGLLILYIDGQYAAQWEELNQSTEEDESSFLPLGNGIAFQVIGNQSPICLSDIVIADWNGVRDPSRSYRNDNHDIVLLHNGIDRYSGRLERMQNGLAYFQSSLGQLQIPVADIAEIHFADKNIEKKLEPTSDSTSILFTPLGRISGKPIRSSRDALTLQHPIMGERMIQLQHALMLQYSDEASFLNNLHWDEAQIEMPEE